MYRDSVFKGRKFSAFHVEMNAEEGNQENCAARLERMGFPVEESNYDD